MTDTVLITGANRGIGLELVRTFLNDGHSVVATCRHPETADVLNELASSGRCQVEALDVADAASVAALRSALQGRCIDILINNAGVMRREPSVESVDDSAWLHTFAVNSIAPLQVATAFKSQLLQSHCPRVVTVSSQMGSIERNRGQHVAYRSSKAAVNMVMSTLATEWREVGICVCMMHPGWVRTDMGGSDADLSVDNSAAGLAAVIKGLTMAQTGQFLNYDGSLIPW